MKPIQADVYCYFMNNYLRPEQMSLDECYQRLVNKGKKEGWQVPTLEEMKAWLDHSLEITNGQI